MTDTNAFLSQIEAAQRGDRQARDRLFEEHRDYVRQQIEKLVGPKPRNDLEASDVAQEVLLGAIGSLAVFRGQDEATFRAWLKSICRNKVFAALRERTRKAPATHSLDGGAGDQSGIDVVALQTSIFGRVMKRHYLQQLERAISWLSPEDRTLLQRRGFLAEDEIPWEQLGADLGIQAATLRKRMSRLIELLREGMGLLERIDNRGLDEHLATVACLRFFQRASPAEIAERLELPLSLVEDDIERIENRLAT